MITGAIIAFISSLFLGLLSSTASAVRSRGIEVVCLFVMMVSVMLVVMLL